MTTDEYCCGWTHGATGRGDCDEYGDPGAEGRGRRRRRRGRGRDGPVCRGAVPAGGPGPAGAGRGRPGPGARGPMGERRLGWNVCLN